MLTPADLRRMQRALRTVLDTCVNRHQALKPKEAAFVRPDLEKLSEHLERAAQKREKADG